MSHSGVENLILILLVFVLCVVFYALIVEKSRESRYSNAYGKVRGMQQDSLWQAVLGEIELSISRGNFMTWFKNTAILRHDSEKIIIAVPNIFIKQQLERKYDQLVRETEQTYRRLNIKFTLWLENDHRKNRKYSDRSQTHYKNRTSNSSNQHHGKRPLDRVPSPTRTARD